LNSLGSKICGGEWSNDMGLLLSRVYNWSNDVGGFGKTWELKEWPHLDDVAVCLRIAGKSHEMVPINMAPHMRNRGMALNIVQFLKEVRFVMVWGHLDLEASRARTC
jgi:hypothetical protein